MNRVITVLLCLVVFGLVGLQYFQKQKDEKFQQELALQMSIMKAELDSVKEENVRLREQVEKLRQTDVSTMVENAGDALITGWNSMLDALQTELHKAEKSLKERRMEETANQGATEQESTGEKIPAGDAASAGD